MPRRPRTDAAARKAKRRRGVFDKPTRAAGRERNLERLISKPPVTCANGKKGFPEAKARQLLEEYTADPRRLTMPRRVYHCPKCGLWHLTSQPPAV